MILAAGHEVVRFSGQVGGECGREERDVQMFKPGFFFFSGGEEESWRISEF